jgi:outer membrane protein
MRGITRGAIVALALTASAATGGAQQAAAPKIAYVNSQAILAAAPGRAEAEAQFEKEMQSFRTTVQTMGDSLNAMVASYQKEEGALSPAVKEQRQKTIQTKEAEYQQRARQLEQQAAKRQQELVQPILDQITEVLNTIREEGGYALILDAQSGANVIVAADKNLDLTERVIARLRTMKPATASTPRPTGAPLNQSPAGVSRPRNP